MFDTFGLLLCSRFSDFKNIKMKTNGKVYVSDKYRLFFNITENIQYFQKHGFALGWFVF